MNFSIPDDIKDRFNQVFQGQNKSAVVAELMLEAIDRAKQDQESRDAIGRILARRKHAPFVTDAEVRTIWDELRT